MSKRVLVVEDEEDIRRLVSIKLKGAGYEVVTAPSINGGTAFYVPDPDFLLSALVGSNHEGFYRQWSAAGMKSKIPMASTVFGLGNELMSMDPAATNGIVTCYGWYNDLGTPASDAFVKGMQEKYGAGVTDLVDHGRRAG